MQLYSAGVIVKKFFDPENMKKMPSKNACNRPQLFFLCWPGCPNGPETEIPYHQKLLNAGLGIQTGILHIFFCSVFYITVHNGKGGLSLFNHFIDMSPILMSPFFVKKTCFFRQKNVFSTKNGLISFSICLFSINSGILHWTKNW